MAKNTNSLKGKVIKTNKLNPKSMFRLEAWDKDLIFDDFLGGYTTNENGEFEIVFSDDEYKDLIFDKHPDVYFKVYENDKLIFITSELRNLDTHSKDQSIIINIDDNQINLSTFDFINKSYSDLDSKSVVPKKNLMVIIELIMLTTQNTPEKRKYYLDELQKLIIPLNYLNLFYDLSYKFLAGDKTAFEKIFSLVNSYKLSPTSQRHAQILQISMGFPEPPTTGQWPEVNPCMISTNNIVPLYVTVFAINEFMKQHEINFDNSYYNTINQLITQVSFVLGPLYQFASRSLIDIDEKYNHIIDKNETQNYFEKNNEFESLFLATIDFHQDNYNLEMAHFQSPSPENPPIDPLNLPYLPKLGLSPFLPCLDRMNNMTSQGVTCFKQSQNLPNFVISDITNVTKHVSREGCDRDTIHIIGENLGLAGKISFYSDFRVLIPYNSWNKELVVFSLPEYNRTFDRLYIFVDSGGDCAYFPWAGPNGASSNDYTFHYIPKMHYIARIHGPNLSPVSGHPNTFNIETCTPIYFDLHIVQATYTTLQLHKEDGTTENLLPSGEENSTLIDHAGRGAIQFNLRNNATLELISYNLCNSDPDQRIDREYQLQVYRKLAVRSGNAGRVQVGTDFQILVLVNCTLINPVDIQLTTSNEAIVLDQTVVHIDAGDSKLVNAHAQEACNEVLITAEADGYEPGSMIFFVYDRPNITMVTPLEVDTCSDFHLQITGNCFTFFNPKTRNKVFLESEDGIRTQLHIDNFSPADPNNRAHDQTLSVSGSGLIPGNWNITVEAVGQTSNPYSSPLVVNPVAPYIDTDNITIDPHHVNYCPTNTPIYVSFKVQFVQMAQIVDSSTSTVLGGSDPYPAECGLQEHQILINLSEPTDISIIVYGFDDTSQKYDLGNIPFKSLDGYIILSHLTITNDNDSFSSSITYSPISIFEKIDGEEIRHIGVLDVNGDPVELDFDTCTVYRIIIISQHDLEIHGVNDDGTYIGADGWRHSIFESNDWLGYSDSDIFLIIGSRTYRYHSQNVTFME